MNTKTSTVILAGALMAGTVFAPPSSSADAGSAAAEEVEIRVLSNRADLVSGGDALVEIVLPAGTNAADLQVTVGDRNVSDAFAVREDGRIIGLVGGLEEGANDLQARVAAGGASITITNHPLGGPVFSGPQVQPWICTTASQGLGAPLDAKCSAPPVVSYSYRPVGSTSLSAYNPDNPPSNVSTTTTDSGKTVPFIVRVEKGSMNRGIYGFAALYDPSKPNQPWAQDNWDHKIVTAEFGGGCSAQYQQSGSGVSLNVSQLGRGFAQISQGLFALGSNCNEIVAAEALMMLRERLIEVYGDIRYVLSTGCSGGSMMQLTISNSYAGLLDGITPTCTYPDQWTVWSETADCGLMQRYWLGEPTGVALWPVEQQKAYVSGHLSNSTCVLWDATFTAVINPTRCTPGNQPWAYNPATNPGGTRCSLADYQVNVFGHRPESEWGPVEQQIGRGFANRPLDNVGVRYGLRALQNRKITTEQFVDLNEKIGGFDIDFNRVPERMEANPTALDRHYRAGRVTQGHNLGQVAIVDGPAGIANAPFADNVEFHTSFRGYMLRDRLHNSRGHDDNHIIVRGGTPSVTDLLDRWLSAVDADTAEGTREDKIVRNRPADATDHCYIGLTVRVDDQAVCAAAWPYYADPRIAAGGPFTDHIMKCQLKQHRRNSNDYNYYGIILTDLQWERLQATFPDGVCDYTRPGVGEQPAVPWQTYADGPSLGRPLGEAPTSVSFGQ